MKQLTTSALPSKKKKSKAERIKSLFVSNWLSKVASLVIAMGVWLTIFTYLQKQNAKPAPPVPGTIPIPKAPPVPSIPTSPLLTPPAAIPGN